jgi:hypothetical protein
LIAGGSNIHAHLAGGILWGVCFARAAASARQTLYSDPTWRKKAALG